MRFFVLLPLAWIALGGPDGAPTSRPPRERGARIVPAGPGLIDVTVDGAHRRLRLDGGSLTRAGLRAGRGPALAGRGAVTSAADPGFLAPIGRLHDFTSRNVVTPVPPLDLDADGRPEILLQPIDVFSLLSPQIWEYDESAARLVLAHEYPYPEFLGEPEAVGDLDGDGIPEVVTGGFIYDPWGAITYVWKQTNPPGYDLAQAFHMLGHPEQFASPPVNVAIDDLDGDHRAEVIVGETQPGYLSIYEYKGAAEGYVQVFLQSFDSLTQRVIVTNDLDDNGRREVLVGGVPESPRSRFSGLFLYEADGDDRYRLVWNKGPLNQNMVGLADAGDSDGDGHKEFLVGAIDIVGLPLVGHCTLYESDGAGGFPVTWDVEFTMGLYDDVSVAAYDLDGDGRKEILCSHRQGARMVLDVYHSVGNDSYELLYSGGGESDQGLGMGAPIGFGDFDGDGHPELLLNEVEGGREVTKMYETRDAFPASPPHANLGAQPGRGSAPLSVAFTDLSDGIVVSRRWDFGDGETSDVAAPTHVYARAGTYSVSLTVTGPGGSDSKTRAGYVRVTPCPATSLLAGAPAGDPDATLGLIRRFRDEVLARSETGRALIEAYYRDGAEVDRLMLAQPGLRWRTARLLLGSPPLLRQALETGGVTLDRPSWADLGGLITEFERSGSAELKGDLRRLRADLQARATTTPEGSVRLAFRD